MQVSFRRDRSPWSSPLSTSSVLSYGYIVIPSSASLPSLPLLRDFLHVPSHFLCYYFTGPVVCHRKSAPAPNEQKSVHTYTKVVRRSKSVNLHMRSFYLSRIIPSPGPRSDDLISRPVVDPVIILTPVEVKVRSIDLDIVAARWSWERSIPDIVRPLVMRHLKQFVPPHMQSLTYAVLAADECCGGFGCARVLTGDG